MVVDFFNNEIKEGQIVIRAIYSELRFHKVVGITSGDNIYLNRAEREYPGSSFNGKPITYMDSPNSLEEAIKPEKEGKKLFYKVWDKTQIDGKEVAKARGIIVYQQPKIRIR